jgi:hypothetical protein
MSDFLKEERARAVEIVKIGIPVICEIVAVTLFIAAGAVWLIIASTPLVPF